MRADNFQQEDASARPLLRLFSFRHEFSGEWHRFVGSPSSASATMTVELGVPVTWAGEGDPGPWTIGTNADPKTIADIFILVAYTIYDLVGRPKHLTRYVRFSFGPGGIEEIN